MGLRDVIASVVKVADGVTKDLQATVFQRVVTRDDAGDEVSVKKVRRRGIVEDRSRRFVKDGVEYVSRTKLTILSDVAVAGGDEFELPSGEVVKVLHVDRLVDPKTRGGYLTEIWLGSTDVGSKQGG